MTNPAMQHIDLYNMNNPPTGPAAVLDMLHIPDGATVATILVGRSTPLSDTNSVFVHFEPLSDEHLKEWSVWGRGADALLEFGGYVDEELLMREVRARWPDAAFYSYPCQCGIHSGPLPYSFRKDRDALRAT
jgi:hypothetical protein